MKVKKNKDFTVQETVQLEGTSQETVSQWEGSEVEAHSDPIADDGSGRRIMLKFFAFKYPPGKHTVPTKNQVLTPQYIKQVQTILYFEQDLEIALEPRVAFQRDGFRVIFPCVERKGNRTFDRSGMVDTTILNNLNGKPR